LIPYAISASHVDKWWCCWWFVRFDLYTRWRLHVADRFVAKNYETSWSYVWNPFHYTTMPLFYSTDTINLVWHILDYIYLPLQFYWPFLNIFVYDALYAALCRKEWTCQHMWAAIEKWCSCQYSDKNWPCVCIAPSCILWTRRCNPTVTEVRCINFIVRCWWKNRSSQGELLVYNSLCFPVYISAVSNT